MSTGIVQDKLSQFYILYSQMTRIICKCISICVSRHFSAYIVVHAVYAIFLFSQCLISLPLGSATIEKFKVRCFDWLDEGERISRDPVLDQFSVLSYAITQTTEGAYLREETVLVSGEQPA